jgi:alkylation response protein AidB-like acyl-CoA dehydrogenase
MGIVEWHQALSETSTLAAHPGDSMVNEQVFEFRIAIENNWRPEDGGGPSYRLAHHHAHDSGSIAQDEKPVRIDIPPTDQLDGAGHPHGALSLVEMPQQQFESGLVFVRLGPIRVHSRGFGGSTSRSRHVHCIDEAPLVLMKSGSHGARTRRRVGPDRDLEDCVLIPSTTSPAWLDASKLSDLANLAEQADTSLAWPEDSLRLAAELGALCWSIPVDHGGQGLGRVGQLEGSEQLASGCLTTAFILSQREAAVRWLLQASEPVRRCYLPALARGEVFATVGLSQLTTSGQHRAPSLRVRASESVYRLDGNIPWITGAEHADAIVTGGVLEDGRQVLLLLPRSLPGVSVEPPLRLAALVGSRTARLHCDGVEVPNDLLLAGPGERLVRSGGGLDTSCLALGLARSAVAFLHQEAQRRPNVMPAAQRLTQTLDDSRRRLHELARGTPADADVLALRVDCTRLVLRATQAALAVAKGTGFVPPHPAQRWFRQAQFFLVWSCPQPVASALLDDLAGVELPQSGEKA